MCIISDVTKNHKWKENLPSQSVVEWWLIVRNCFSNWWQLVSFSIRTTKVFHFIVRETNYPYWHKVFPIFLYISDCFLSLSFINYSSLLPKVFKNAKSLSCINRPMCHIWNGSQRQDTGKQRRRNLNEKKKNIYLKKKNLYCFIPKQYFE